MESQLTDPVHQGRNAIATTKLAQVEEFLEFAPVCITSEWKNTPSND